MLGVSNDRFVEVVEGLYPGERVVTEGNYSLQYLTPIAEEEEDSEDAGTASAAEGEPRAHSEGRSTSGVFWALGALGALAVAALGVRMLRGRSRHAPEAL